MFLYRVAEPNQALIISGWRAHSGTEGDAAGLGFKIIVGKGVWVVPGLQKVRKLSLDIHEAELELNCVTTQGIAVHVKAVVVYKIADDQQSIANAARRFLEKEDEMDGKVYNVFAGHLRSIVGTMTIEDMLRNRDALTKNTRESSSVEMQRLGLTIDSLQIQEMDDETGYIKNLSAKDQARVAKEARIAQAQAQREAAEAEAQAAAEVAAAQSASAIKQSQANAQAQEAAATAQQAGPLADARARQEVVVQETKVAELEAARTEQQLQVDVRKPADARAYETRTIAEAQRDATIAEAEAKAKQVTLGATADAEKTKLIGKAEAEATLATGEARAAAAKAAGLAEAASIEARAAALAQNQEAVIGQQLAEKMPEIIGQAAEAFKGINNLTVLNGAQGISEMLAQVVGAGASLLPELRRTLSGSNGESEPAHNGHSAATATAERGGL